MKLLGAVLSISLLGFWTPRPVPVEAPRAPGYLAQETELGRAAAEVARSTGANVLVSPALRRVPVPAGLATPGALAAAAKADAVRLAHVAGRPTWALVPPKHVPAFTPPAGERATPSQYIDFVADEVEAGQVFATLAVMGRVNVVAEPGVARAKLTLHLRQTTPLQALYAIAQAQGLAVTRVSGIATATYLVQRPEVAAAGELFSVPARVSRTGLTDFAFRDVEVKSICDTIAVLAGVNLVVDPQVARARMQLHLRQVTPVQALRVLCAAQQLGARVMDDMTRVTTVMVARHDKLMKRLKWTPPRDSGARLSLHFKDLQLSEIFATLGRLGGVNLALDPSVARAMMSFDVEKLTALEAIGVIAEVQELGVAPAPFVEPRTLVIGRSDRVESGFRAPALRPGPRKDRAFDGQPFTEVKAALSAEGGFTIEDRGTEPRQRTAAMTLRDVTPAETLALMAWMYGLQMRATATGYALDPLGTELREAVLGTGASVIVRNALRDTAVLTHLQGSHDADARLRHFARQTGARVVTRGAGADRIRLFLLDQPHRAPVPLVRGGPRMSLRASDRTISEVADEISQKHGATVVAAGQYFWPTYSMELDDVSVGAVVSALAAVEEKPLRATPLTCFSGRPAFLIAPPSFAVPAFPARPAREARQHIRFAGLPWEAAVRHLARLGGFQVVGRLPEPRGQRWSDTHNAALDLPDTTPLEALYLLALRNGLKVVADRDAEVGSTYRLE